MPEVSILIPCYNANRWIAESIRSALSQTHGNKEVIVVDDGSTDGSLEVIKSFGNQIRWETGPNRGGNAARNRLLELASGEWVQYLDADDYLLPGKIQHQLQSIGPSSLADIIYSPPLIETWQDGAVVDETNGGHDPTEIIEVEWIRWRVAQTGTMLWRAKSLRSIGGWNEAYQCCQDNELTLRAIFHSLNFQYVNRIESVYRIWSEKTVCRRNPCGTVAIRSQLLEEMLQWLEQHGRLTRTVRDAAGRATFEMARTIAVHDLDIAARYCANWQARGFLRPSGASAPLRYRLMYNSFGFRIAETIARWWRK